LHLSGKESKPESRLQELEALFPSISEELEKTGFTLQYLWYRYKITHPEKAVNFGMV